MISKEMIAESRENVSHMLVKYFEATEEELARFENKLVIEHGIESWTCGFEDELVPLFLEVRNGLNNNTELLHEQLIKEMQLTPEEIIEYKKNNNLK